MFGILIKMEKLPGKKEAKEYGPNARMSYIYFSNSRRLYYIEPQGYMYINTINNYRRFYFGTLNHK